MINRSCDGAGKTMRRGISEGQQIGSGLRVPFCGGQSKDQIAVHWRVRGNERSGVTVVGCRGEAGALCLAERGVGGVPGVGRVHADV